MGHETPDEEGYGEDPLATEAEVQCPHCGAVCEIGLDPGGDRHQSYVEDCQVCCRPWLVTVHYGPSGEAEVSVDPLDG